MADEKQLKKAKAVYDSLCALLDSRNGHYEKHEEDLVVTFIVGGDDIPMHIIMKVDAERELVRVHSPIPVTFEGDKRIDGAIATSQVNYGLADGSFDYDFKAGRIVFRMTSSYRDSLISENLLEYMIGCASYTIDEYNDKFLMLSKGMIPLESFFAK